MPTGRRNRPCELGRIVPLLSGPARPSEARRPARRHQKRRCEQNTHSSHMHIQPALALAVAEHGSTSSNVSLNSDANPVPQESLLRRRRIRAARSRCYSPTPKGVRQPSSEAQTTSTTLSRDARGRGSTRHGVTKYRQQRDRRTPAARPRGLGRRDRHYALTDAPNPITQKMEAGRRLLCTYRR
jgi:hypothetical protein